MTARSPLIATTLGLPRFPGTTLVEGDGGHIMGVVVLAWLTEHPVRRWGEEWATRGTMRLRYRQHLDAGTPLTVAVTDGDELGLQVVADPDQLCADGTAGLAAPSGAEADDWHGDDDEPPPDAPARPFPDALRGRVLRPLAFDFDADRDLAFVDELTDGEWWRRHGWAHPAWVASGANAVIGQSIAFDDGGYWRHAGSELHHLQPIRSGARLLLRGHVDELFQGRHHRFGVARITVLADDAPAAILRVTFVYGEAIPPPPR